MTISTYQILNVLNNYSKRLIQNKAPEEKRRDIRAEGMRESVIEKMSGHLVRMITERISKETTLTMIIKEEKS